MRTNFFVVEARPPSTNRNFGDTSDVDMHLAAGLTPSHNMHFFCHLAYQARKVGEVCGVNLAVAFWSIMNDRIKHPPFNLV